MGSLNPFKKVKAPAPVKISSPAALPIAVAAPTAENNAENIAKSQAEEKERLKKQKGRAATMLTGGRGVLGDDTTSGGIATKTLMGG
jgi:hypothetical protein